MLLGVDVGGTFTDGVLVGDDGAVYTAKVPSSPQEESRAVLAAVDLLLADAGVAGRDVRRFAHGMTVATNALLEGRTARTALIATEGFTDVIEIGRQARPHLYRLAEQWPPPLVGHELRFAARERMGPEGPLIPLTERSAGTLADEVAASEPDAVAVCLLHSYADASHERAVAAALRRALPGTHVSLSSETVGTFREYERTATTVIDAALSPALAGYLRQLAAAADSRGLPEPLIMQSSGGLTGWQRAAGHAAVAVLSGPAGGAAAVPLLFGERSALCFDMGGTSCDVCVVEDGRVAETTERTIGGRPVALPALDIQTVGAGGGSIAWRDAGGSLRVGPQSAGAVPGPACYCRGGTLPTVTDANLLLGRLPDAPLAGSLRLDRAAARAAIDPLAASLGIDELECAEGIISVTESAMLAALRVMTVERGVDPRPFALVPFGGAGPLHATALAESLQMSRVLCPRSSGVLSALGLAAAAPRRDVSRTVLLRGAELTGERVDEHRSALLGAASASLGGTVARSRVRYEMRYAGQAFELSVDEHHPGGSSLDARSLRERFADAHRRRYGYADEDAPVELVTVRASVWGEQPALAPAEASRPIPQRRAHELIIDGETVRCDLHLGEPPPETLVEGPSLWALEHSTLLVRPGWHGSVDERGTIALERR
ncbi:MAG TPA: hydantoinase/oxoprolinase family protein [Solirubrobacteraceae bacterium]|nr:hydantoinase/oxoprolinase family protein [Solirubrobacteraceae bacterium]